MTILALHRRNMKTAPGPVWEPIASQNIFQQHDHQIRKSLPEVHVIDSATNNPAAGLTWKGIFDKGPRGLSMAESEQDIPNLNAFVIYVIARQLPTSLSQSTKFLIPLHLSAGHSLAGTIERSLSLQFQHYPIEHLPTPME